MDKKKEAGKEFELMAMAWLATKSQDVESAAGRRSLAYGLSCLACVAFVAEGEGLVSYNDGDLLRQEGILARLRDVGVHLIGRDWWDEENLASRVEGAIESELMGCRLSTRLRVALSWHHKADAGAPPWESPSFGQDMVLLEGLKAKLEKPRAYTLLVNDSLSALRLMPALLGKASTEWHSHRERMELDSVACQVVSPAAKPLRM